LQASESPVVPEGSLRKERLVSLATKKLKVADDSSWLNAFDPSLRDHVNRIIRVVIAAKDFVSTAVSAEPHAALAWAGVCVLLPVRWSRLGLENLVDYPLDILR
jgi:hypothetical protein